MAIRFIPARGTLLLYLFLALLLILRALLLLAALGPAEVSVLEVLGERWPRGPQRALYDPEELIFGATAEAIRQGLGISAAYYRYGFGGGGLINAHLAIPVYSFFGPYYLSYKLIPLALTLLCGGAWVSVVRRWLGARSAWLFAGLFLFAPSTLVRNGLLGLGTHAEALAALGVVFFVGTRAAQASGRRSTNGWAVAAGFSCGLAVFVSYSALPALFGVGLAALVLTRARPRQSWLCFFAGGLAGLIPWLAALATGVLGLRVYGRGLGEAAPVWKAWTHLRLLVGEGFFANYDLPGGPSVRAAAGWIFALAVVCGWCALIGMRRRRPIALLVLAGSAAHLLAFVLRAPVPEERYVVPCYALLLIAVVCSAELFPRASRSRLALWATVVLLGVVAQLNTIRQSSFPALRAPLSGVSWAMFGEAVGSRVTDAAIRQLPERLQPFFWIGYGRQAFRASDPEQWRESMLAAGAELEVWQGVGRWWVREEESRLAADYLRALPRDPRAAFARGLATAGERLFGSELAAGDAEALRDLRAAFDERDRTSLDASLAYTLAVRALHGTRSQVAEAERMAAALPLPAPQWQRAAGRALYREVGSGQRLRFWQPPFGSWLPEAHASLSSGGGSASLWRGVAAAYNRDLRLRSPHWLIGGEQGPVALAAELASITRGLEPGQAAAFYRTAGEATAWALSAPFVFPPDPWRWELPLPEEFRRAFRTGLESRSATILRGLR